VVFDAFDFERLEKPFQTAAARRLGQDTVSRLEEGAERKDGPFYVGKYQDLRHAAGTVGGVGS
jgi:hypothetical protein